MNKEFKCGQKVWLIVDNQPSELKIRAVNTLERLQGEKDVIVVKEYFVDGIDDKIEPDKLFNSLDELLASFKPVDSRKKGDKE